MILQVSSGFRSVIIREFLLYCIKCNTMNAKMDMITYQINHHKHKFDVVNNEIKTYTINTRFYYQHIHSLAHVQ